ncbi:hypothetical protein CTEN210_18208 [Chaetoceros tenuissimus]|uniref:MYND-type domain-containing protein n=1 Tax=Chaetoceros tenuissimus TaxID=426638 RepID=A0AAD3DD12_9STRA|nr:hypothetical protein CTEN210_18208 [Chaetoceros tenuissimus]
MQKFKGAKARLFAELCHFYISAAEDQCNDAPYEVPLFSGLSPHQRLHLVREVMIGLLCENELMFPDTIQHHAAYLALTRYILECNVAVEIDCIECYNNIGDDLFDVPKSDDQVKSGRMRAEKRTEEELQQLDIKFALMEHTAEKTQKKMQRSTNIDDNETYQVKEESPQDLIQKLADILEHDNKTRELLFQGGPISKSDRESIRELNSDEKFAFKWRILLDNALQDGDSYLAQMNFDFKCTNNKKWVEAIRLLFFEDDLFKYSSLTHAQKSLVLSGYISDWSYSDPSKLPFIRELEKQNSILRKEYEENWDENRISYDQRCIYAVSSSQIYAGIAHKEWLQDFVSKCDEKKINILTGSDYQVRLEIFHETNENHLDGLKMPYGAVHECRVNTFWRPEKFESMFGKVKTRYCYNTKECYKSEDLRECSRCRIALYCSIECQHKHWPEHKRICKQLAKLRKDKAEIQEMAKSRSF